MLHVRCKLRPYIQALFLVLALATPLAAQAVEPDEILADAALESRARKLSADFRCLVCQNQSIDDSNAPLARDLRVLVRERLRAGDTDAAIRQFAVARYGEFILLRPPFGWHTALLWLTPFLALAGAFALVWRLFGPGSLRDQSALPEATPLTAAEEAELGLLLRAESVHNADVARPVRPESGNASRDRK